MFSDSHAKQESIIYVTYVYIYIYIIARLEFQIIDI